MSCIYDKAFTATKCIGKFKENWVLGMHEYNSSSGYLYGRTFTFDLFSLKLAASNVMPKSLILLRQLMFGSYVS